MISDKELEYILERLPENAPKCWMVTNEAVEEKAVFSVEQESLDFMKDIMQEPAYREFDTKREPGVFVSYQDLKMIISDAQNEGSKW